MRSHRSPTFLISLPAVVAAALLFAGCAATTSGPVGPVEVKAGSTARVELEKGMPIAKVKEFLGKPDEVKPAGSSGQADVWIYRRTFDELAGLVMTGT
jgi:hypothetical protein